MARVTIVDYKAGNLASVAWALEHLGHHAEITDEPLQLCRAERIILPGVGAAGATMENLNRLGLSEALRNEIVAGKPFLGICIGIQVLLDYSDEDATECLGIIRGRVLRYPSSVDGRFLKVPQIGWNRVHQLSSHPLFQGVPDNPHFYFVNAYYLWRADPAVTIGTPEYGLRFPAARARDNVGATKFHLEKSGAPGLKLLDNFCRWQPARC